MVFAGVFDPVHKGHISAAETALKLGKKVVFLPEKKPQHKHGSTAYKHRIEMLKIATRNNKRFEVMDYPENEQFIQPVFTWLAQKYPKSGFIWLLGSDSVKYVAKWPDADKLPELNVKQIVYLERHGHDIGETYQINEDMVASVLRRKRRWNTQKTHAKMNSMQIRDNLKSYQNQLPDGVYEYIREHNLYNL